MLITDMHFCFAFVVPGGPARTEGPWVGEAVGTAVQALRQLFRSSPALELRNAGLPSDLTKSPLSGHCLAKAERTWLSVRHGSARAMESTVSVGYVDRSFLNQLRQGDVLYTACAVNGSRAISVLRDGELLAAAGAISAVPLGTRVVCRIPLDLAAAAHSVYQQVDPEFGFAKVPVQVAVDGHTKLSLGGRFELGRYDLFVEHPYYNQTGAIDECAAISLRGAFSSVAANSSAQFLAFGGGPGL